MNIRKHEVTQETVEAIYGSDVALLPFTAVVERAFTAT
jgi:hypothetical protein